MQTHSLSAGTGWRWVRDGFGLLRRQPIAMLAIVFLNLMVMSLSVVLPLFGPVAPLILAPGLSVGLMHAMRENDAMRPASPLLLFAGFRDASGTAWRGLLVLGAVNAAFTLLALALAGLADGGTLMKLALGELDPSEAALAPMSILYAGLVFLLLYLPLQMAMWYAPVLHAWHRIEPLKALFFSFVTMLRNKRAFFVYAIGWFGVAFLSSLGVRLIAALVGDNAVLMSMLLSPLSLLLVTAAYCSLWPTYRDVFVDAQLGVPRTPALPS